MTFTIEPMIALGKYRDVTWPDNWTSATVDGKKTAQFGKLSLPEMSAYRGMIPNSYSEQTLLVTEDGVEILTARKPDSPGGPLPRPETTATNGTEAK